MNDAEFAREFRSKTLAYQPSFRDDGRPVVVEIGPKASTVAGHALVLALTNMLARTHRHLIFIGDLAQPLLCPSPFGCSTLSDATVRLSHRVNPLIRTGEVAPASASSRLATLSIGATSYGDLALGADGWQALTRTGTHARVGDDVSDIPGACLAACLGAWFCFRRQVGQQAKLRPSYPLWDHRDPTVRGVGGSCSTASLDGLRLLQVGVGGVGAAVGFWASLIQPGGQWLLIDGDFVEVSNLNRQLLFLAEDTCYALPAGRNKAQAAGERLQVAYSPEWYGTDAGPVDAGYDVVLPLANERGVRSALQDRPERLLMHATTSTNFQAQLHRHERSKDDCIRCRIPTAPARLGCSEVTVGPAEDDAALPFLSGLAGLLLIAGLVREVEDPATTNFIALDLGGATPTSQALTMTCRSDCHRRLRPGQFAEV